MKPRLLGPFIYNDGYQLGSRGPGYYASVWVMNLTLGKPFMYGVFCRDGEIPESSIRETVTKVLRNAAKAAG